MFGRCLISIAVAFTTFPIIEEAQADVLSRIAHCESRGLQFNEYGGALRNSSGHIGVFQFSKRHAAVALRLGYNVETLDGNWAYARYVVESPLGTTPWIDSEKCWRVAAE